MFTNIAVELNYFMLSDKINFNKIPSYNLDDNKMV